MSQSTSRSSVSMAVRSGLWMLISMAMIVHVGLRIHRDALAGQPMTHWIGAQLVLWVVVFCFWIFGAIWDWKRRKGARKVV